MIKRITALVLCLLMLLPFTAYASEEDVMQYLKTKDYYAKIIAKEFKYIESLALDCGAIGMFEPEISSYSGMTFPEVDGISPEEYMSWPSAKVIPYFSDSAVMGIIKCDAALGTTEGKELAEKYINWYISRMNTKETDICGVAGTVYDYYIFQSYDGRTVEVTLHDAYASQYKTSPSSNPYNYDSTDSYAAMFLEILYEYTKTYDSGFLKDKREIVDTLVDVIMSTYKSSVNLTIAKPNYAMCYLMDNCEVYCGFISAGIIYGDFYGDSEKSAYCNNYAEKVKKAILTKMWDEDTQCFYAAISPNGSPAYDTDLTQFYPQASCQLFPIIFGIMEPTDEKAVKIYERFIESWKTKWLTCSVGTYPWCKLLNAVVEMEDYELAQKYVYTMNGRFIMGGHKYPYYNSESGSMLRSLAVLYTLAPEAAEESSAEEISTEISEEPSIEESTVISDAESAEESVAEEIKSNTPWIIAGAALAVAALAVGVIAISQKKRKK